MVISNENQDFELVLRVKKEKVFLVTSTSATERLVFSTNNQPMKLPALSIASTCTST